MCHSKIHVVIAVELLTCVQLFVIPRITARQASLSFTICWSFLRFTSIELEMLSKHLILCHPLLLFPSVFQHQAFELALHIWWPKYWSFCFSISPSNEYSELISFRIDWFDLLIVQGTLKSLLQPNSKASILWRSAFFMVQLSHPDMTTGKTRTLTIWTFVSNSRGNAFKHIQ